MMQTMVVLGSYFLQLGMLNYCGIDNKIDSTCIGWIAFWFAGSKYGFVCM